MTRKITHYLFHAKIAIFFFLFIGTNSLFAETNLLNKANFPVLLNPVSLNCDVEADFKYEIFGNTVVFYAWSNDRQNIDEYQWKFSDGTWGQGKVFKKEFRNIGSIEVCLTVIRPNNVEDSRACTEEVCKTINLTDDDDPCAFKVDFSYEVFDGVVVFKGWSDNPANTDNYVWEFDDRTRASGTEVKKEFKRDGEYKVCLTIYKRLSNSQNLACSQKICKVIKIKDVENPCGIRADFDFKITGGNVEFYAKSDDTTNTDRFIWEFDDNTRADGQATKKQYRKNGTYKVCMTVVRRGSNADTRACTYKICKEFRITDADNFCGLVADFRLDISGNIMHAIAKSSAGNRASYSWKVSDGTTGSGQEFKHQFRKDGAYEICLTVTLGGDANTIRACSTTICKKIVIGDPILTTDCPIRLDFDYTQSNNWFAFEGKSNVTDGEYYWTIEGPEEATYRGKDLRVELTQAGTYKVCLNVFSRTLGCSQQICKRVVVQRSSDARITPNPVTEAIRIQADQVINTIQVYDMTQGLVKESAIHGQEMTIDLSQLRSGVYFVHIQYSDGNTSIQRIIKQ